MRLLAEVGDASHGQERHVVEVAGVRQRGGLHVGGECVPDARATVALARRTFDLVGRVAVPQTKSAGKSCLRSVMQLCLLFRREPVAALGLGHRDEHVVLFDACLLYTSPSPRDS